MNDVFRGRILKAGVEKRGKSFKNYPPYDTSGISLLNFRQAKKIFWLLYFRPHITPWILLAPGNNLTQVFNNIRVIDNEQVSTQYLDHSPLSKKKKSKFATTNKPNKPPDINTSKPQSWPFGKYPDRAVVLKVRYPHFKLSDRGEPTIPPPPPPPPTSKGSA